MQVNSNHFPSIEQVAGKYLKNEDTAGRKSVDKVSFFEVLKQTQKEVSADQTKDTILKFSKHASQRLNDRNINLSPKQLQRLEDGAQKASDKGIKDSLVLLDNLAFIINTKNKTVVTAMNSDEDKENIYTNIDGAVII